MTIDTTKENYPQLDKPHKMTNREWLQSLSDEEVARFIHTSCPHDYCEWSCSADNDCLACITKWLQAEHKEVSE